METARSTTSFIVKATVPIIAGKPAAGSQPSGRNGMIVTVVTNVPTEGMAPRTPALGFQKPQIPLSVPVGMTCPRT